MEVIIDHKGYVFHNEFANFIRRSIGIPAHARGSGEKLNNQTGIYRSMVKNYVKISTVFFPLTFNYGQNKRAY